ncbi:MAG: Gfo/Idh/MocA family oxidoreductase [Candidatus Latescibacteria bacterium]|nr:Gfo/Idh/MocA family oxidoreductase [Candidatus Latescibacterota bacterium]
MVEERKIRAGFIGCGGHAFRNIYPTLQFAPVDLVATCDLVAERAQRTARQFGALRAYTDYREMLEKEDLEGVFIVTGYDPQNRPLYPGMAMDCMRAGCHAWIEKPPAASVAEIEQMMAVERETGKFTMVGLKKAFFPAIQRMKEITERPEFGGVTSICLKYPQSIPAEGEKDLATSPGMRGFLDHIVHPGSIIDYVMGKIRRIYYERSPNGGGVMSMQFVSRATGVLHFTHGRSGTGPLERVEVVGQGANVVVDNGVRLTYYRPGGRGEGGYGRATNFMGDDAGAPITWEPEWSLGQLYNKQIFLLGYAFEVIAFAECILEGRRPERGSLDSARELMKLFEAFQRPPGEIITINP